MKSRFEIVTDSSKLGKSELTLLVKMLTELKSTALESFKSTCGYHEDPEKWDTTKLEAYQKVTLATRMKDKGYTFFILRDEKGDVVALASGNVNEGGKQELWIFNMVTAEKARGGHMASNTLLSHIADFAIRHELKKIGGVISPNSVEKGNLTLWQKVAGKFRVDLQRRGVLVGYMQDTLFPGNPNHFIEYSMEYKRERVMPGNKAAEQSFRAVALGGGGYSR